MPEVSTIVDVAPIAQYLAATGIPKKGLYGGGTNILLPQKIYNIYKDVKRIYDASPNDSTLQLTANFLWSLLGIWGSKALSVAQLSGNTSSTPTPSAALLPLDWIVSATATALAPLANGESTVALNGTLGFPDFRGFKIGRASCRERVSVLV